MKKAGYNFNAIEKKWQRFWAEHKTFKAKDRDDSRAKYYVLDMFPYPSAAGLHVGHPEGYTASDIVARYKRMKGFNVLHPMGWDAFGLPAEQYAVQTGTNPKATTAKNVDNIRRQIKSLGFSYDWDREVNTTDPNYYKWTQWIFLKFFNSFFDETEQRARPIEELPIPDGLSSAEKQKYIDDHRLAYEAEVAVNWCPALGTVLANEEVIGGISERGGHPVIRKPMRQWMLRITKYAERLLEDLAEVDWPESIKKLQIDWIGKSVGADVDFKVDGFDETIRVFTTRPDTLFGATYMVLAPEHPLVEKGELCFVGDGRAINSGRFNGLSTDEFKEQITNWLAERSLGRKAVNFKLRDWLFSRQRYWGEPFPILHTGDDCVVGLSEEDLPLELPVVENYKPAGTGESPLANIDDWVTVSLPDDSEAKRETNTMPQWAGSCWYYLRYLDPDNNSRGWNAEKEKYWMPVDLYIGGAEHAVLHLLYSRFWHKLLYDLGYVSTKEPFQKLVNQGMILGEDGQKMSKSRGNVINPDKVVADYGADSMRLYEMFMGPLEAIKPWSMQGVEGVHRFLQKTWRMIIDEDTLQLSEAVKEAQADEATLRLLNQTIKKVGDDIESFGFNTAISAMMICVNHLSRQAVRTKSVVEKLILILAPFAPHIAEELWEKLGHTDSLAYEPWPDYDSELIKEKEIERAVQVNGKIKDRIVVAADADEKLIENEAQSSAKVKAAMAGKPAKKIIVTPRVVSIIT